MDNQPTVLIVEDDLDLARLLKINLTGEGFKVHHAGDGLLALELYKEKKPDLAILDVMLPKLDGFEVCKRIRKENRQIPILMLTAKSEEVDKVLGLELGADDYLTKPFSVRELLARVKAIFRRIEADQEQVNELPEKMEFKNLIIYPGKRKVLLNDESIDLTSKEYDLLTLFASNPGKAYSREQLLNLVWGYQYDGYSHTVNSHINRLRNKIEKDPSEPYFIRTVWGVGYRFVELEENSANA
ncbi:MAG: response regulator transcription factor [Balneolaceae bacterium]